MLCLLELLTNFLSLACFQDENCVEASPIVPRKCFVPLLLMLTLHTQSIHQIKRVSMQTSKSCYIYCFPW